MTTRIVNNTYQNGKRVSEQVVTYSKSDDLRALADAQHRLASLLQQLDDGNVYRTLESDIATIEAEIAALQGYVNGYTSA